LRGFQADSAAFCLPDNEKIRKPEDKNIGNVSKHQIKHAKWIDSFAKNQNSKESYSPFSHLAPERPSS
jgi:hypothetical protein